MTRSAARLLDRGYKRVLFVLLAGLMGGMCGILAFRIDERLPRAPQGSWKQLPQPPARLTGFVGNTPMSALGGTIYAATADGTLYAFALGGESEEWSQVSAVPTPPPADSYWAGTCPEGDGLLEGSIRTPQAPGRVVDSYAVRYCGPDYQNDVFFILLEDGSVWEWNQFWSGMGQFYGRIIGHAVWCWGGTGLSLLAAAVVVFWAVRRSRPTAGAVERG
jgi:hypothetical protein